MGSKYPLGLFPGCAVVWTLTFNADLGSVPGLGTKSWQAAQWGQKQNKTKCPFSSVQSLRCVWLFVTPWTAAHQASLSITNSRSLLKLMSIESVMPSNHLNPLSPPSPPAFNLSQHQGLSKESVIRIRWPNTV